MCISFNYTGNQTLFVTSFELVCWKGCLPSTAALQSISENRCPGSLSCWFVFSCSPTDPLRSSPSFSLNPLWATDPPKSCLFQGYVGREPVLGVRACVELEWGKKAETDFTDFPPLVRSICFLLTSGSISWFDKAEGRSGVAVVFDWTTPEAESSRRMNRCFQLFSVGYENMTTELKMKLIRFVFHTQRVTSGQLVLLRKAFWQLKIKNKKKRQWLLVQRGEFGKLKWGWDLYTQTTGVCSVQPTQFLSLYGCIHNLIANSR